MPVPSPAATDRAPATDATSDPVMSTTRSQFASAAERAGAPHRGRSTTTGPTRLATGSSWETASAEGVTSAATKATDDQVGRPSVSAAASSRPPASRKPDHRGPATRLHPEQYVDPTRRRVDLHEHGPGDRVGWVASRASPAANVLAPTPPFPPTTPITGATDSSTAGSQAGPRGSRPATNGPVDNCWPVDVRLDRARKGRSPYPLRGG